MALGTVGLHGIIDAGTNSMNIFVVAKESQGLANYLGTGASMGIGYEAGIEERIILSNLEI